MTNRHRRAVSCSTALLAALLLSACMAQPQASSAPTNPLARWCNDTPWTTSAAALYTTTYVTAARPITPTNVYAGMGQGGSLSVNYAYQAENGSMPSGIDPKEMAAYFIAVAKAEQGGQQPSDFASAILQYCSSQ